MLPGERGEQTAQERKSLLFNTFPRNWRDEFTLNRNNPENAPEQEIIDFMEKKKELTDAELSRKERTKSKKKKLDESKKKREKNAGNTPCRLHNGEHLWKDCPNNRKNRGKTFNRNSGRGPGGRHGAFQQYGRGAQGRGGRFHNNQGRGFGKTIHPNGINDQYHQQYEKSDNSTLATNQGSQRDWDDQSYYQDQSW